MSAVIGLIFYIVVPAIFGAVASSIAKGKHRDPVGWFFGGFFLGVMGIIIVAVLSDPEADKNKHKAHDDESRRLREQLKQERMKNEVFRKQAYARLDVHDEHLDVDTRSIDSSQNEVVQLEEDQQSPVLDRPTIDESFSTSKILREESDGPVIGRERKEKGNPTL